MKQFNLEIVRVSSGYISRPVGTVGTMGSYPFLWTAVYGTTARQAEYLFRTTYKQSITSYEKKESC